MKASMTIVLSLAALSSLTVFILCAVDKLAAKSGACRIPEKVFLLLSVLGGGLGLCFGMLAFHHKTGHWYFRLWAVLFGLIWLAVVIWLPLKAGGIL